MRFAVGATLVAVTLALGCGGAGTAPNPPPEDGGSPIDNRPSNVSVAEDKIDLGFADCGGAASAAKAVKITNTGGGSVSWTAELESAGFSILGASSGTFTGGGSVNVKVQANPFPTNVEAGTVSRATLVIVIDKSKIFRVPLVATSRGATIAIQPGDAVFGEIPINTEAPDLALAIKNTGNAPATISFEQPSATDFGLTYTGTPASLVVLPGASVPGAAAKFRPARLAPQATTAPIKVKGAVCGASATGIKMTGKGTGGVVGVSPGQLDYGKVNCGAKGNFQVLTLLNSGTASFTWNTALGQGASSYFDISPSSGTVLAGSQTGIFVTPKDIPATSAVTDNLYGDVLTITTDAANDTPHAVNLLMGAKGAILDFTTVPVDYGTRTLFGAATNQNVTVTNSGNAPATVTLNKTTASFSFGTASSLVSGPGAFTTTVAFSPASFGDVADTMTVSTGNVLCAPLPAGVALTGKGKGSATSVAIGHARNRVLGRIDGNSTCAVITGGHIACWGDNALGQLGIGNNTNQPTPVAIPNFAGAVQVATSGNHTCSRMSDGKVYCWGSNTTGELGVAGGNRNSPVQVASISNAIYVATAYHNSCAIVGAAAGATSGKVSCWGARGAGNLGNGSTGGQGVGTSTPVDVTGLVDATAIGLSGGGGCARRATGNVVCWGQQNGRGQLGTGNTSFNNGGLIQTALNVVNATTVSTSGKRRYGGGTCALIAGGTVQCWGGGRRGQVDLTTNGAVPTPATVTGISGATAIAKGNHHTCAIVAGGAIKCWGGGESGQLGNNATPFSTTSVQDVVGISGAVAIGAGGPSACAVLNTGVVTCWGGNASGQLGNPAATGTTPTTVFGF